MNAAKWYSCPMDETRDTNNFAATEGKPAPLGRRARILWTLCILLFVYPLSVGPAAWLQIKVPAIQPIIEALYAPIGMLCELCPPFQIAMFYYLVWVWRVPLS